MINLFKFFVLIINLLLDFILLVIFSLMVRQHGLDLDIGIIIPFYILISLVTIILLFKNKKSLFFLILSLIMGCVVLFFSMMWNQGLIFFIILFNNLLFLLEILNKFIKKEKLIILYEKVSLKINNIRKNTFFNLNFYNIIVKINKIFVILFLFVGLYLFLSLTQIPKNAGLPAMVPIMIHSGIFSIATTLFIVYYLFYFLQGIKNKTINKIINVINKIINIIVFIFLICIFLFFLPSFFDLWYYFRNMTRQ
jgi:hypothetical protein